eukprot:CAMPEP_0115064732 /NCGR_PEP_ID=MMETSP0227-20121206/9856_1 /TAXON_ID=89957 /ORGANISM="Polarella glacialis, Strain CCMP 1383" /LENGTH=50 /DNA_ID=CAMNT_0002450437 /DNA_START=280 /DNA_END=432 /DNA_ORIENTATION=+
MEAPTVHVKVDLGGGHKATVLLLSVLDKIEEHLGTTLAAAGLQHADEGND